MPLGSGPMASWIWRCARSLQLTFSPTPRRCSITEPSQTNKEKERCAHPRGGVKAHKGAPRQVAHVANCTRAGELRTSTHRRKSFCSRGHALVRIDAQIGERRTERLAHAACADAHARMAAGPTTRPRTTTFSLAAATKPDNPLRPTATSIETWSRGQIGNA